MTPRPVPSGLIALALGWVLGGPAPAAGHSAPALEALLRPGQSVTLAGVTITAPALWRGRHGPVDATRLSLQRLGRNDLDEPLERGQRLAGPIYVLKAVPAVYQDARQSFTLHLPRPQGLDAKRVVPAIISTIQVDAEPPHPGGTYRVWSTPDAVSDRTGASIEISGLDEDGLVFTAFLMDTP